MVTSLIIYKIMLNTLTPEQKTNGPALATFSQNISTLTKYCNAVIFQHSRFYNLQYCTNVDKEYFASVKPWNRGCQIDVLFD